MSVPIASETLFSHLIVAGIGGVLIAWLYRTVYEGANYSPKFARSIVFLAMITALVVAVIGNNLARAFGLVGTMSIIRFRTAVKDTLDIVFIFFALAVGMAAGVGLHAVAMMGTGVIGAAIFVLSRLRFGNPRGRDVLLQFDYVSTEEKPAYLPVLQRHCRRHRLVNVQTRDASDSAEYAFHVELRDSRCIHPLLEALQSIPGLSRVRFFFDEQ